MCAQRLVNVRANAGEVREANHKAVGLASGWQVAKQFARQPRTVRGQGVREVRTILGYSGSISLSADTHLIILPGFEYERAQEIVDAVQPSRISLGHAGVENSVSPELNLDHENFLLKLEALYLGPSFDRFDFSCLDPFKTRDNVLKLAETSSNKNVVVACLNTKPAMFGVCLAALANRSIQLVYAQPISYNTKTYSKPSGEVLFFTMKVG